MDKAAEKDGSATGSPPKDRFYMVYLTMILLGVGILIAWNTFITAKDYFVEYKMNDTEYANSYLVYVGYASQIPNLLFSWFNVFLRMGREGRISANLGVRIAVTLMCEVTLFVMTVILAMVDSSSWPGAFFFITMLTVFLLNALNAIFENSVFGVATRLPPHYIGAVVLGTNLCGTLVVLLNWLSSTISSNLRTSAIYYFIGTMFVHLACLDTYFALPLNTFYRYYDSLYRSRVPNTLDNEPVPYLKILKQCWVHLYNIWVVFFTTLSIFPAIHTDIYSMDNPTREFGKGFLGANFVRVTCFLTLNFMAMIGNITATFWKYPTKRWLVVFTTARLIFIPLFLLCNYHPRHVKRTLVVVFKSDAVYWIFSILLGWSAGHGSSLGMMYVTSDVDPEHADKAGMIGGAMLITGLLTGIAFSGLGPHFVS